ncbi:hypothetical protein WJX74_006975 [Apatococcus lobatus]|uniref:Photolyase/cryptochrome alpha/beta domain-containing protein n=1 Tax=Apatococcus lobatus TaxID=904363 RepID=A0AAW1RSH8_9CHLO
MESLPQVLRHSCHTVFVKLGKVPLGKRFEERRRFPSLTSKPAGSHRTCRVYAGKGASRSYRGKSGAAKTSRPVAATLARPCVVWFKHDLRLDDHPGLAAALEAGDPIIPFFCFDPAMYAHLVRLPCGVEGLLGALRSLRDGLRALGSDLIIRAGSTQKLLPEFVRQVNARQVIIEEEVEHRWNQVLTTVKPHLGEDCLLTSWHLNIFDTAAYGDSFQTFRKRRGTPLPPVDAPAALPPVSGSFERGDMPTVESVRAAVAWHEACVMHKEVAQAAWRSPVVEPWRERVAQRLASGEGPTLAAFRAYLTSKASPAQAQANGADFEAFVEAISQTDIPATPMGSFPAIFAQPLALGTLSRRRVAHEAQGLLSHLGSPGPRNLQSVARAQSAVWSMQQSSSPSQPHLPKQPPPRAPQSQPVAASAAGQPPHAACPQPSSQASSSQQLSANLSSSSSSHAPSSASVPNKMSQQAPHQPSRQHSTVRKGTAAASQDAPASASGSTDESSETQQRDGEGQQVMAVVVQEAAAAAVAEEAAAAASGSMLGPASQQDEVAPGGRASMPTGQSGAPGLQFQAALQQLLQWGGGRKLPAEAALATVESADFHWQLANVDRQRWTKNGLKARHWRWRGFLTDYYTEEVECAAASLQKPAVLLVHGFGAFGEQWRSQIKGLTEAGYQVFAPTLPGYGRSEKPALAYSQHLWSSFLREFVVEVVRRPVVVVGNSIGGYISASLAAESPNLVQGLVLMNSAGQIDPGFQPASASTSMASSSSKGLPRFVVEAASRSLYFFLQRTVPRTLKRLYPTAPSNAQGWLADEILRAASDPGALGVFQSVFYLPKPLPLNHLVRNLFQGPAMVLSGAKDPLNDAGGRAQQLKRCCPDIKVVLVEAGHCPHDERPDLINIELMRFLADIKVPFQQNATLQQRSEVVAKAAAAH